MGTTLVQTMVRIYNLKPAWTWKDLTHRSAKKFRLDNDHDAFMWLKSHSVKAEVEDLHAKAFDKALQRIQVPHLDRRIFWSELDKDASGGISYEEFKGKLYFVDKDDDSSAGSPRIPSKTSAHLSNSSGNRQSETADLDVGSQAQGSARLDEASGPSKTVQYDSEEAPAESPVSPASPGSPDDWIRQTS